MYKSINKGNKLFAEKKGKKRVKNVYYWKKKKKFKMFIDFEKKKKKYMTRVTKAEDLAENVQLESCRYGR